MLYPVCVLEGKTEVLQAQTVVEKLLEGEVLKLVLVLHFDLDDLVIVNILESDVVFAQVDVRDTLVVLEILTQNEQVFTVELDL